MSGAVIVPGTRTPMLAWRLGAGAPMTVQAVTVNKVRLSGLGAQPLAEITSFGHVAGPCTSSLTQPYRAIADALGRSRLAVADLDGSVTLSFFGLCTDPVKGAS